MAKVDIDKQDCDYGGTSMEELDAMKKVAEALADLEPDAIARVLRWATDKFGVEDFGLENEQKVGKTDLPADQYDQLADLFAAADPSTEAEKVLVTAYWLSEIKGATEIKSLQVNKELKQLGHPISTITREFNNLVERRPQLIAQTKKAGATKQARKSFKLTQTGRKKVESMLGVN